MQTGVRNDWQNGHASSLFRFWRPLHIAPFLVTLEMEQARLDRVGRSRAAISHSILLPAFCGMQPKIVESEYHACPFPAQKRYRESRVHLNRGSWGIVFSVEAGAGRP